MKKQILFVDDEINVLDGLRRALRSQRKDWQMSFAESALQALQMAEQQHFDAVVTDMRMPGMDGPQLLTRLQKMHPDVLRIVLSGQSDHELTMRSVMPAHQYMNKPCEIEVLKRVLNNAFKHQENIKNERLLSLVSAMENLPSLPSLYIEMIALLQDPEVGVREVGNIIAQDLAMTSKILQLINSAFFYLGRNISNPVDAASLLGLDVLKSLVLSIGIFSQYEAQENQISEFSMDSLWMHSLKVATLAKQIAKQEECSKQMCDDAFFAGLLHDIGKLILAQNIPETYTEVFQLHRQSGADILSLEEQLLGAGHAEVGAYLLGLWGLPQNVVDAVGYHHKPEVFKPMDFSVLTLVHVANAMIDGEKFPNSSITVERSYLLRIGKMSHLETWLQLS